MRLIAAALLPLLMAGSVSAQVKEAPPTGSRPASEIVALVEAREGFAYLGRVELASGVYRVLYYMADGAEVSVDYDPLTGEPAKKDAGRPTTQ